MIQFDTTDDDASVWPDVPQQPLPAKMSSVRSVDAKDPESATLAAPSGVKEPGHMRRSVTAKREMSERRGAARRPCVSHGLHRTRREDATGEQEAETGGGRTRRQEATVDTDRAEATHGHRQRHSAHQRQLRMGRIFDSYSKFRIFQPFPVIRFEIRKFAAI